MTTPGFAASTSFRIPGHRHPMQLTVRSRSVAVAIALCACSDAGDARSDVASRYPSTPLNALRGVRLGMTSDELKALRPGLTSSPYSGAQESLDGALVYYQFERGTLPSAEVGTGAELEAVTVAQAARSFQEAQERWKAAVAAISAEHGPPNECRRVAGGSQAVIAIWQSGRTRLEIVGQRHFPTGSEVVPDRVTFTMTTREEPPQSDAVRVECSGFGVPE